METERRFSGLYKGLEAGLRGLRDHFAHRAQSLQSAQTAYEEYRSGRDRVLHFLSSIPSYEPQETDSLGQVETKLKNQKVWGCF